MKFKNLVVLFLAAVLFVACGDDIQKHDDEAVQLEKLRNLSR